jgi:hypothetical protein
MKIFISYAREDGQLASQLADQLQRAGFSVWVDARNILPGDNWAKEMGLALEESDVMVALISKGAMQSESLRRDVQYALTAKNYDHRLIPVLVGYVTFEAGEDVPWILLKMDPIYVESGSTEFGEVVQRVGAIARQETNAPC